MQKFSERLKELDEIVEHLNDAKIDIEESMQLYEKGMKIIDECEKKIEQAKGKLKIIDIKEEE